MNDDSQWITGPESIALLDCFVAASRSHFNSALRCSLIIKTDLIAARRSPLQALIISSINESSVGISASPISTVIKNKEIWATVRSTPQSTSARRCARQCAGARGRGHRISVSVPGFRTATLPAVNSAWYREILLDFKGFMPRYATLSRQVLAKINSVRDRVAESGTLRPARRRGCGLFRANCRHR